MRPVCVIRRPLESIVGVLLFALSTSTVGAGVVTYRLGEQDFAQGAGPILVSDAATAGGNEASPFDGSVFGDDRRAAFGRIRFAYRLSAQSIGDGSLTLGLIGLDSPPGSKPTVKLFVDGVQQPNDIFAGVSSPLFKSSASVVTVSIPAASLTDGEVEVLVKAFRRGPGYPGNAISADFSTLMVTSAGSTSGGGTDNPGGPGNGTDNPGNGTDNPGEPGNGTDGPGDGGTNNPPAIPLPPAVLLGGIGLGLAALLRKRA